MRLQVITCALLQLLAVAGCSSGSLAPKLPGHAEQSRQTFQGNLLLYPKEDGESLLGRPVHATPDGAWTIADARAPGCDVQVTRTKSKWKTKRVVDVHSLTTVTAGFAKMVGIEARYGRVSQADVDIENTEVLTASTRGDCGETYVSTVFVGHGKRTLLTSAEAGANAQATIGQFTPGASHEASSKLVDESEWGDDQAYGFTLEHAAAATTRLELHANVPRQVTEGANLQVRFESTRPAYLVVFYLDANGRGDVLWPSNEESAPMATPAVPAILPSAREQAQGITIKATLTKPGTASRETLVAYAFTEKADFDRFAPGVNGNSDDGAAYAAEITKELASIPLNRWARVLTSYTIMPDGSKK